MGSHDAIDRDRFPAQGRDLNRRAQVCFRYDTSRMIGGTVVRDDVAEPWVTVIRLDDGRHVLATECQYRPDAEMLAPDPESHAAATSTRSLPLDNHEESP